MKARGSLMGLLLLITASIIQKIVVRTLGAVISCDAAQDRLRIAASDWKFYFLFSSCHRKEHIRESLLLTLQEDQIFCAYMNRPPKISFLVSEGRFVGTEPCCIDHSFLECVDAFCWTGNRTLSC